MLPSAPKDGLPRVGRVPRHNCPARTTGQAVNIAPSPRWPVAAAGVLMQVALGAVYAWSVFRIPLTKTYGWTIPEVSLAFEIAILVVGFASFIGGVWMRRAGPRPVAFTAALLYGCRVALAGPSAGNLVRRQKSMMS